jgi:uncharacterized protein with HEPN domain
MSFRGPEMHFRDILRAIGLIEQFVGTMDFQAYAEDINTRAAVERELQIVTGAAQTGRRTPLPRPRLAENSWHGKHPATRL